ncbi:MAG: MATE family efflux transporter, partial [Coriobacteriia bacterium]|nr:MATE family efflux transporter [Coriobacteriia bacterium]
FFAVQIVFYGAGAIINALLNSQRRYFWPAIAPVFNNLVVIVTLLGFYVPFRDTNPDLAKAGLAIGTSLGVLAMVVVPIPDLIRLRPRYALRINLRHPALRLMGRMAVPSVLYVVTNLVAVSFRNAYALQVSLEGPATLLYAWMFYQLPYGVLGVALATAVFTELSDQAGRDDWTAFKGTFLRGFRATGLLILPMAAMLVALAEPLVTLYQAGRFTAEDVPAVAQILRWWGVALFFYASSMFVLRTFYSLKDTRTPMIVNGVLTVLQVGLYATLTVGLAGWAGIGLAGIPVTDMIFYALLLATLVFILRRRVGRIGGRDASSTLVRVAAASVAGGGVAYGLLVLTESMASLPAGFLLQLAICGVAGLGTAYGLSAAFGVSEVAEGVRAIRGLPRRLRGG